MDLDTVTKEPRRALDDEEPQPQTTGAGRIDPVERLKNVGQVGRRDADAVVPYLEVHRRAAPTGSDEHATAARRIVDRVADEIAQYAAQQCGIARHGGARRDEAKPDPFEPCRFGELRFGPFEHRTELDGVLTSAAGGLE